MLNLLRIEWLKIKNYTAFKVLAIFFIAGVGLTNYIVYVTTNSVLDNSSAGAMMSSFSPYSFPNTWNTTSYATGCLLIMPAMLVIILVTNEYTFKTNRQNIIDGWSRHEFISVKIALSFIIAIITTILVIITAILFGIITKSDFSFDNFSQIGFFFLKALTYNLFAVLISVLVKKTGFAIGLFFIYLGAENGFSKLLDVWSMKLKHSNGSDFGNIGDYLPMNAADGLIPFPNNPLKSLVGGVLPTDYTYLVLGLAIVYLTLFIVWSRAKYLKADL
jgi:ABC-2 type transport system permease protein